MKPFLIRFLSLLLCFLGFFFLMLPFFLFIFRFFFNRIVCFNIVYPFPSIFIYFYLFFLFVFYLLLVYKIIKSLFFFDKLKKGKLSKFMEVVSSFFSMPIVFLRDYMLFEGPFAKYYRKIYTFFVDFYFIKKGQKSRLLFFFSDFFITCLYFFIVYIPIFIFLVILFVEVLIYNKLEYIYFFLPLLIINRIFGFVFEQFFITVRLFCDWLKTFLIFQAGDQVNFFRIDYNNDAVLIFFDYYKDLFLVKNNYSGELFSKDLILQIEFKELFTQHMFYLLITTINIVGRYDFLKNLHTRHTLLSNLFRLLSILILVVIVLFKNFN